MAPYKDIIPVQSSLTRKVWLGVGGVVLIILLALLGLWLRTTSPGAVSTTRPSRVDYAPNTSSLVGVVAVIKGNQVYLQVHNPKGPGSVYVVDVSSSTFFAKPQAIHTIFDPIPFSALQKGSQVVVYTTSSLKQWEIPAYRIELFK